MGVEGFAGYRNPCWELYKEVVVLPLEEFLDRARETWDTVLLLEVLEPGEPDRFENQMLELAGQTGSLINADRQHGRRRLSPKNCWVVTIRVRVITQGR